MDYVSPSKIRVSQKHKVDLVPEIDESYIAKWPDVVEVIIWGDGGRVAFDVDYKGRELLRRSAFKCKVVSVLD